MVSVGLVESDFHALLKVVLIEIITEPFGENLLHVELDFLLVLDVDSVEPGGVVVHLHEKVFSVLADADESVFAVAHLNHALLVQIH